MCVCVSVCDCVREVDRIEYDLPIRICVSWPCKCVYKSNPNTTQHTRAHTSERSQSSEQASERREKKPARGAHKCAIQLESCNHRALSRAHKHWSIWPVRLLTSFFGCLRAQILQLSTASSSSSFSAAAAAAAGAAVAVAVAVAVLIPAARGARARARVRARSHVPPLRLSVIGGCRCCCCCRCRVAVTEPSGQVAVRVFVRQIQNTCGKARIKARCLGVSLILVYASVI